ncbi:HAMP domain-containing protein [uncultured Roseobacter sp.]|uniref:HAMP domain-containing protein n=1 Tax=uncultured Roseobacter sp. TaxID=114847 RepID=UPI00263238D2|nr:HAMP domain-containing protein [uncultured Roseobacter sp.]
MIDDDSPALGRFDKSFLIHMIRDFFIVLVIVTLIEFSLKAALVYFNYQSNGEDEAAIVANDLAENVRSIMLNEGGPVAARTMYPILEKNWSDLGYTIAIEPSPVTVISIEEGFGFTPQGIPATEWLDGQFKSAELEIVAEDFCLACHSQAEVGDTLGTITVRNYLARDFALWLEDVRLTATLSTGKILLHSFLLFLILRARLEPLMELRAVVSNLARAYGNIGHRAEIRTSDEFGVLARDLNLFLDRISRIVAELDTVLGRVVSANDDIIAIQSDLRLSIEKVVSNMRTVERDAMLGARREPRLSNEWFSAVRGQIGQLDAEVSKAGSVGDATELLDTLKQVVSDAETQIAANEKIFEKLAGLGDESDALKDSMLEMTRLEERLQGIVETCSALVRRLQPETSSTNENS